MDPQPIVSCIRLKPGPDVAVMAFFPPQLAPIIAPMDASSSSICMNIPPICGSRSEKCSVISFAGDIGYPAKNWHPAIIAASTHASFPCQKYVFVFVAFIFSLSFV